MEKAGQEGKIKKIDLWESPLRPYVSLICEHCGKTRHISVEKFKKGGPLRLVCSCGNETSYLVNFRRSFRIKVNYIPVQIDILRSQNLPEKARFSGAIVDMSSLGLGISLPRAHLFSRGDLLNLSFPLPDGMPDPVIKRAEVMCADREKSRIGVAFVDSYDGDQRIALFVRKRAFGS